MATSDDIKNTYGSWIRNTGGNGAGAAGIASSIGNAVDTAKNAVSNRSTSGPAGTGAATYTSVWAGIDPIDSYEEFLRNREPIYGTIRDATVAYWDEQSKKTLATIEEQRQAAYKYAADQRDAIYATAESQRVAAEQRADVVRERGVVDARSSYEQSKASYGTNAEAMGSMGLSGSGYSDYLNSKAYAQQRAETQAANAQADASKREARFIEDQTRLQADASYSENLFNADSQARSDKLTAEQTADKGKFDANMSYQENLLKNDDAIGKYRGEQEDKEEQRADSAKGAYYQFLAEANQGKYTVEQVTQLAADYGLSEEQKQSLIGAVNDYATNEQERESAEEEKSSAAQEQADYEMLLAAANSGAYTRAQLEQLAKDKGLSEEHTGSVLGAADEYTKKVNAGTKVDIDDNYAQGSDTLDYIDLIEDTNGLTPEEAQNERRDVYLKDIDTYGTVDVDRLNEDLASGKITQAAYGDIKERWNNRNEPSVDSFFDGEGRMYNKSAAKETLDNILKQPLLSAENKSAIQAIYNSLYSPVTMDVTFNNDGGWWIFGSTDTGANGNNFSVITSGGTKYRVEYGGEATDTNIKEVGESVGDGQVFGYQEKLYIKQNGKVYKLKERSNTYGDHYDALYNIFFGSGDPTSVQSAKNAGNNAKTAAKYSSGTASADHSHKETAKERIWHGLQ